MDGRTNEDFTEYLRGSVREAERLKYFPNRFKGMLEAGGGFDTVKRILESGKPSEGFKKLWELGRLDLTCEAIIVETKWRPYFDQHLIARAEKLLRGVSYRFKPFEVHVEKGRRTSEQVTPGRPSVEAAKSVPGEPDADPATASGLRINAFFREVLHAPVANARWSWGSVDERRRRVFLRLWRMDLSTLDGRQLISVLGRPRSDRSGWRERARHVELINGGHAAYGVVCDKDSPEAATIRDFDHDYLLRLGRIVERDGRIYMEVDERVPVESVAVGALPTAIESDLRAVEEAQISATTRSALVDARLGQGRFRRELMRRWGSACAVTGCRVGAVLRASHCKPWRASDNSERLDSNNGLVLAANLDALFDAGLITFDEGGEMLVASVLSEQEQRALGLPEKLMRSPGSKLRSYLTYHREHVFLG